MSKHTVSIDINGTTVTKEVDSRMLLVHFIREELQMTGTHIGCDTSSCGACTILMNGRSVKSCTLYTVQANGKSVKTIEGMEEGGALHPLQEGFHEEHGLQCGFCTPGMIMRAAELLEKNKVTLFCCLIQKDATSISPSHYIHHELREHTDCIHSQ